MELKRLRLIREENNLKQKDIAKILNVSLGTYAMNETAHDTITLKNLVEFCDYFNISLDYVLGFTEEKNYSYAKKGLDKNILKTSLKKHGKKPNLHKLTWMIYLILIIQYGVDMNKEKL